MIVLYQIKEIFDEYHRFPTFSKVTVHQGHSIEFPAVTICGVNRLAKQKVNLWFQRCEDSNDDLVEFCEEWKEEWESVELANDLHGQIDFEWELFDDLLHNHPVMAKKLSLQFSEMMTPYDDTSSFGYPEFNVSELWTRSFTKFNCYSFPLISTVN